MFTLQLPMRRETANSLTYIYRVKVKGKYYYEYLTAGKDQLPHRTLYRHPSASDKVFYQFDDVCLSYSIINWLKRWGMSAELEKIRPEFIQLTVTHLMYCANEDLPELQNIVASFLECSHARVIHTKYRDNSLQLIQEELSSPLKKAIESLSDHVSVESVLAAAIFAQHLPKALEKPSIKKLAEIIKQNCKQRGAFRTLGDPVRRSLSSAVAKIFNQACRLQSAKEATWIMALFYSISPAEADQSLTFGLKQLSWTKAQSDLSEMIKTHSEEIKKHKVFASSVLEMFFIKGGDIKILSNLSITPQQFLTQLSRWLNDHTFQAPKDIPKKTSPTLSSQENI
ncbi:uncharacterized protein LOC125806163 [Astyanax mexicanus]|uniref:uncharacterized protein LOC125806163 n=1 Tax=Astyanax mexicanus TaxID=7994 RepID=UPI0020CB4790|nr:uncharacterized protein LOC125806163 [Astyanax mexicanus]